MQYFASPAIQSIRDTQNIASLQAIKIIFKQFLTE